MRAFGRLLVVFGLLAPALAHAQPLPITVDPGEAVTITIDADGADVIARAPVVLTPYERALSARVDDGAYADATGNNPAALGKNGLPPPAPIVAGRLRVKLVRGTRGDMTLFVENGYARAFTYRVRIFKDDIDRATDVCLVMPGKRGVEHWPFPIDRIELSRLKLSDWKPGDPVPCA